MRGTGTQRHAAGDRASKNGIWIGGNNAWERRKGTNTWGGARTRVWLDTVPQALSAQELQHRLLKSQSIRHTPHTKWGTGESFYKESTERGAEKLQKAILYSEPFLHLGMKSQGGNCLGKPERAVVQRRSPSRGEPTLLAKATQLCKALAFCNTLPFWLHCDSNWSFGF